MNSFGRLNRIGMEANATKDKVRYLREKYNLGYDMQPKEKKMTLNTEISTTYAGKRYTGCVVEIKMVQNREMITIMIEDTTRNDGIGYRSLYTDKMSQTSENFFA